jgi:hypothetical protein
MDPLCFFFAALRVHHYVPGVEDAGAKTQLGIPAGIAGMVIYYAAYGFLLAQLARKLAKGFRCHACEVEGDK